MKKKKAPLVRINVCFAINAEPATFQVDKKMNILGTAPKFKMKRLFDVKRVAETFMASEENTLKKLSNNQAFALAYEHMPEAEKRLHRIWQMEVIEPTDVDAILATLNEDPNVEFAEVEQLHVMNFSPNDPLLNELYGLSLLKCAEAWDISQGEGVVVAVVDSGVDYNHPDIAGNMWRDADNNVGRDFSGDDNTNTVDNDPMDTNGHGTHVAGTIAAVGNNGQGVIGVAPKVRIMAVKIFPNSYDGVIANALKYAADNGANVINNSWGPKQRRESSKIIEAAVDYAHERGCICVFAAGNGNDEVKYYSPANKPNTIAVAATDKNDERAHFSNYGDLVDVSAPGVDILSARHRTTNYVKFSGTSMAAPHVSGAVALLLSKYPSLGFDVVKNILQSTAKKISSDQPIGTGRIDCLNLVDVKDAPPLVKSTLISKSDNAAIYVVTAFHPYTQASVDGDIYQTGSWVGKTDVQFSVPLICETKTIRRRECDPERKPPCYWEVEEVTICEPLSNNFLLKCKGLMDAVFKLPKIQS